MTEQYVTENERVDGMREEFLRTEELFLLEFLKSFDRRTNREWADLGY